MNKYFSAAIACFVTPIIALQANAQEVKITPLGSHDGEFCRFDRALIWHINNCP